MSQSEENKQTESRPTSIGPGDRLQAARIQQGMSVEDVATRMHLSSAILEAIEENSFEEITAPIFVKGYLRAYARIVALDEDEMIDQYVDFYSEEDPPIHSTSNMAPELSVDDARIKWTTYLVIIVIGALLAAWWWNKEQVRDNPISLDSQSSSQQSGLKSTELVVGEVAVMTDGSDDAVVGEAQAESQQDLVEQSEVIEAMESEAVESDSAEVAVTEVEPAEPVAVEAEAIAVESSDSSVGSTTTEMVASEPETVLEVTSERVGGVITRTAPGGSDRLRIIVNADTWADIEDSSGYRLAYDLLRADQSMILTGNAPFVVFFGNGHGVEVLLNDAEIAIAPFIRDDNTARLKIGG